MAETETTSGSRRATRGPLGRAWALVVFVLYTIRELVVANLQLAWIVIQPRSRMDRLVTPGIIAIPLRADRDWEILVLSTVITLTPGTVSMELESEPLDPARDGGGGSGDGADRRRTLYVHSLQIDSPDAFRAEIADGFERRLLRFSRGLVD